MATDAQKAISPGNKIAKVILVFQAQNSSLFSTQRLSGTTINKFVRNDISVILQNTRQIFMSNRGNVDLYSKFCSSAERINSTETGLKFLLIGCKYAC